MREILFGVAYYDEYMPYDRLDKDIEMMKKAGINTVRIAESTWSTCEPQDGLFDFSHVERVMDAMEEAGINVIIGTPTYAVPAWMVKAHPDVIATTKKGAGIYGARQIMDITNPVYLFYAERVIRKLMEISAHRKCVIGFQVDNETKYYGTAGRNVQLAFVKYLREKFHDDLDAMNYEFGLDYWSNRIDAWEDFPDVRGTINGSLKHDNYLVLETQAQGFPCWTPYKGQLRLCAYSHLASGANSVMYWHWHSIHNSFETCWKGLLSHDLAENDTYREVCIIGKEFREKGSHMVNLKKKNDVAVMVSNEALTALNWFGIQATSGDNGEIRYNDVVRWIYDALYRMNVECDFVWPESEDLSQYKAIFVPALYAAPDSTLERLNQYVKDGGTLVVTFKSGFANENVKVHADVQPHILKDALGISYDQFTFPHNVKLSGKLYGAESLDDFARSAGADINSDDADSAEIGEARVFMELLKPEGAEVLAGYEHYNWKGYAAITRNQYGKGMAYYLGCMTDDATLQNVIKAALGDAGVKLSGYGYPVIVREGTNDLGKTVRYFLNYSAKEQSVAYKYSDGEDVLTGEAIKAESLLIIPAWNVRIVED